MVEKSLVAVFLLGVTGVSWAQFDAGQAFDLSAGLHGMERERVEDFMNRLVAAFKGKCETNGGPDAFANAENTLKKLHPCMAAHINGTVLIKEVELAKQAGTIDEVFKKYCAKRPQYLACFNETVEGARSCFSSEEQESLKIILDVIDRLAEFVCFKDGDRLARNTLYLSDIDINAITLARLVICTKTTKYSSMFIAERGPECIMDKLESLRTCARSTFGDVTFDVNRIPDIKFTDKQCGQLAALQPCVVSALATCARPTPARIVDSLFKTIRAAIPCQDSHRTHETERTAREEANASKHMDYLMQRKLELEIRSLELEIWNKENQLGVKHTILTSDIQKK